MAKNFKIFFGTNTESLIIGVLKLSTVTFSFTAELLDDFYSIAVNTGTDYLDNEVTEFASYIYSAIKAVNPHDLEQEVDFASSNKYDPSKFVNVITKNYMYELSRIGISMSIDEVESWKKDSGFHITSKLHYYAMSSQSDVETRTFLLEDPMSKQLHEENIQRLKEMGVVDNDTKQYHFLKGAIASKHGRQFFILFGPSGTGKSTDPRLIAKELGSPIQVIACNKGTDAQKLMSEFIPHVDEQGQLTYRVNLSPAVHILQHGGILLLDEINMLDPRDMSVLNGLFDGSKKLFLVDGTPLYLNENAIVIGTMNPPIYEGTQKINAATLNRAKVIEYKDIDFDEFNRRLTSATGSDNSRLFSFAFETIQYIRRFFDGRKLPADFNFRSAKDFVLDMTRNYAKPLDYLNEIFHSSFIAPAGANTTVGYEDFVQVMEVRLRLLKQMYNLTEDANQVDDLLKGVATHE
jgi:hypothetical protein